MVIENFPWDPSTSVANLTDSQIVQLCNLINSTTTTTPIHQNGGEMVLIGANLAQHHSKPSSISIWTLGLIFVTLINMCAVIGIGVMRYLTKNVYNQVITLFVGLGVGSLSGSSFYHLLPQAHPKLVEEVDDDGMPTYSYLNMAHISILGVYAFFFCDKLIKIVLEIKKKNSTIQHRRMSSIETGQSDAELIDDKDEQILRNALQKGIMSKADTDQTEMIALADKSQKTMGDQAHGICVHDHSVEFRVGDSATSAIAAVAWMIIFGDGLHNFIDGISIGAAFADSIHSGLSISLAVLCEEFPHELGDVAILVASGMSLKQALIYNLLSAITCYIGFFIGVAIGELGPETSKYAFGLAGGMFLYISLACMMPEMKKAMEEALNVSLRHGIYVLFLQSIGLFSGLTLMYVMARYGEEISV
ncbi:unnamed protein product [Caenorhabditis bovis]|uniref:Uncharacterized protein n=1 Tax=Caenorhabditis bovis TaxID=2654633 RepID=A0A8S1F4T0_9PELO|nr:unnamed protein product [Caenorhabditis bovis]